MSLIAYLIYQKKKKTQKTMCLQVSVLDYKNIMVSKLNVVITHTAYIQFHWTI